MKFRKDFVTNSSSSSFICEICGNVESGFDLEISEAGMCQCENGHTFCQEHVLEHPSKKQMIKAILKREFNEYSKEELFEIDEECIFSEYYVDSEYGIPESLCPICQFIDYSELDFVKFLLKEYGISKEEAFESIKKINKRRKKLYNSEYIAYVCQNKNLNAIEIVSQWKDRFGTYSKFRDYIYDKNN